MIPLRDANPSSRTPWVTFLIIGLNILAFLYEVALPESRLGQLIFTLGMGPARGGGVPGGPGAGGLGGYLLLYPHARVLTLIPAFFLYMVELPAYIVLALWFVIQLFSGTASLGARDLAMWLAIQSPTSEVLSVPPRSRAVWPSAMAARTASSIHWASWPIPRWSSIIPTVRMAATGPGTVCPAYLGAEPCTGST